MTEPTGTRLSITRGLPGSGKTTLAREWVAAEPGRVRVNRDDLRATLFGRARLDFRQEQTVSTAQQAAVRALLLAGTSVIIDDTHLRLRHARAWADLAAELGVGFSVLEVETDVEESVRRDAARAAAGDRSVGEDVIREIAQRFGGRRAEVLPTVTDPACVRAYVPDLALPVCVLVDIDGTVALIGDRGRYEEHLVGRDLPNPPVVELVRLLHEAGREIVFLSGRGSGCREQTVAWLDQQVGVPVAGLFMRDQGDQRNDAVVKLELLHAHVATRWQVSFVLDDRDRVVAAWRAAGLTVLQVADGNF